MLHSGATLIVSSYYIMRFLWINFFTYILCGFIISGVLIRIFARWDDEDIRFVRQSEANPPDNTVLAPHGHSINGEALPDIWRVVLIRAVHVKWADLWRMPPRRWCPKCIAFDALWRIQDVFKSVLPCFCPAPGCAGAGLTALRLSFQASGLHPVQNGFHIARTTAL